MTAKRSIFGRALGLLSTHLTACIMGGMVLGIGVGYLVTQNLLAGVMTTEQVRLILSDSNSSALVQESDNDDSAYVVMPMRL